MPFLARNEVRAFLVLALIFGPNAILRILYPQICWLPRLGGLMVGTAVFIQGYLSAHEECLTSKAWDGNARRDHLLSFSWLLALVGTLFWTFGDFPEALHQAGN